MALSSCIVPSSFDKVLTKMLRYWLLNVNLSTQFPLRYYTKFIINNVQFVYVNEGKFNIERFSLKGKKKPH
jgi:hypothetical protein